MIILEKTKKTIRTKKANQTLILVIDKTTNIKVKAVQRNKNDNNSQHSLYSMQ